MKRKREIPAGQKDRGSWVEMLFIAECAQRGWRVSRPMGDYRYDVVVESASGMHRVQIKSTTCFHRGFYECLCSWAHSRGGPDGVNRYTREHVDFVAVYVIPEYMWFIFPVEAIRGTTIALPGPMRLAASRHRPYFEAWDLMGGRLGHSIHAQADETIYLP